MTSFPTKEPSNERKWSVYSSDYLYKESKKMAIDLDFKDYEYMFYILQIGLGLKDRIRDLDYQAKIRNITIEELVRDFVTLEIKDRLS
ncbi:hypothetical protein [Paenibacillus jiagnxiensis]|uniref:hypothetical protein n=1 Tax=Paenibacillus jiagnxiensis TaxID=3228926 RepID=UPI0033B3DA1D